MTRELHGGAKTVGLLVTRNANKVTESVVMSLAAIKIPKITLNKGHNGKCLCCNLEFKLEF